MSKFVLMILLAVSLAGCSVNSQNSDKQKESTNGPIPQNAMTATEQQNYGAGNAPQNNSNQGNAGNNQNQSPDHTNNLTKPSPTTPIPQASKQNAQQNVQKKK